MFDFFLINNIDSKPLERQVSFLKKGIYKGIDAREYCQRWKNGLACYLEREDSSLNYSDAGDNVRVFVYGSIFTNNACKESFNQTPKRIYAREVADFYQEHGDGFVTYVKGSFVVVIQNETTSETRIVTDRMNVLPLYYYFNKNVLIVSSSVRMILETGIPSKELNHTALVEQSIFDYVLGSKTYFKEISAIPPASIVSFGKEGKKEHTYWDVQSLYQDKRLPEEEALERLAEQLHENVQLYTSDTKKVLVAFTGGFDGRTNVAMLDRPKEDYLCFSFGMPGSRQITIPKNICHKIGLDYRAVELGTEFERQYTGLSDELIEFSNGTAPIIRANYPFAFKQLSRYSSTVLTGVFGSEILRPIHNLGIMMNDHSERLFLADDAEKALRQSLHEVRDLKYLSRTVMAESFEYMLQDINQRFMIKYRDFDRVTRLFFFLLEEGIRKYFMQEIQLERPHVTNRFPYFDDDLVQLIYRTPFAGMYNGFLGKSKIKRRKGQLLYAHIIRKYNPELGKYAVDRGYTPDDLIKPFPFNYLNLFRGVMKTKKYVRTHGDVDFDSENWVKGTVANTLFKNNDEPKPFDVFSEGLSTSFTSGKYKSDLLKYTHMISLVRYFESLGIKV